MPQPKGEGGLNQPTFAQSVHLGFAVACGLAALTEPATSFRCGKNYYGPWNVGLGFLILCGFVLAFPAHGASLARFLYLWLFLVAVQSAVARWHHYFGRRRVTTYAGDPLIAKLLPMPTALARRVVTPAALFGLGVLLDDRALSVLVRSSAVGQFVMFAFSYAAMVADDDARSDLTLLMRSRNQ